MGRYGLKLEDLIRRQLLDDEQTLVDGVHARGWAGGHERGDVGSLRCTTAGHRLGPDNDAVRVAGLRRKAPNELESGFLDRLLRGQGVHTANVRDRHYGDWGGRWTWARCRARRRLRACSGVGRDGVGALDSTE